MTDLTLVADAAYPFDYSILPPGVEAVAGYIGGDTPHAWTTAEIRTVEATGRQWWPIWTAPNPRVALSAEQGGADGSATVRGLKALGIPKARPVFYDIERSTFDASPSGAVAARIAWRNVVRGAGWLNAFAYWPLEQGSDWAPNWTYQRPTSLPEGIVGLQFQGPAVDTRYDLSVFRASLLGAPAAPEGDTMTLTAADLAQIGKIVREQTSEVSAYYLPRLAGLLRFGRGNAAFSTANSGAALVDGKGIDGTIAATSSVAGIAAAVAAALPADLAAQLANELAKRLQS